jgi:N6-L-threonylcarbamoyladenine synthase
MNVLGIETSCDETSVALLHNGTVVANEIYSQTIHATYGGVVPEIASRAHLQKVDRLCKAVLQNTDTSLGDIDLIAVTDGPGLAGALLVGISFAIGLHKGFAIPITGIHHLEGHICSMLLEQRHPPYPFLALSVSGGHSAIYAVHDFGQYESLGQTVDDAAGEAFDKVGKMLGFDYPAGRSIEQEAMRCTDAGDLKFPVATLATGLDFSFSGLKTAVKYHIQSIDPAQLLNHRPRICHAFQQAVIQSLVTTLERAVQKSGIRSIALVGGVACNQTLRGALQRRFGEDVFFPIPLHCTDNAAMIARAGYERALRHTTRFPSMNPARPLA